jgi:hypothetical protein
MAETRAPRGRKAVYIELLTQARLTQAAAELGRNVNDMAEAALREYLKREAAALFEREFALADQSSDVSVKRWEFERAWKPPAWGRE